MKKFNKFLLYTFMAPGMFILNFINYVTGESLKYVSDFNISMAGLIISALFWIILIASAARLFT